MRFQQIDELPFIEALNDPALVDTKLNVILGVSLYEKP